MLAIDTNILVRIVVRDDPQQTAVAAKAMGSGTVFVPVSVSLETEWVLRSYCAFDRDTIVNGLSSIAGLRNVIVQNRTQASRALAWFAEGMDFGDALHMRIFEAADAFVTFDRALIERAKGIHATPVRLP